jgi:hypothetical protein
MSPQSRRVAAIIFILLPTVMYGGWTILRFLISDSSYMENELRQNLWRAGHAHAGVFLVLSLVALIYVDQARLGEGLKWLVRVCFPSAAIFLPAGFFLSVVSPSATEPSSLINLVYVGAALLAMGLLVLGFGLLRGGAKESG